MPDLVPGTLILGLFLTPDNVIRLIILGQQRRVLRNRERIDLFDPNNRDIVDSLNLARFQQIVVNLAAAEDDATRFLRIDVAGFRDKQFERARRTLLRHRAPSG